MKALHINGNELTPEAVREVAVGRRSVLLDSDARARVGRARAVVDALVAGNKVSYAITTGVGKLSDVRIAGEQIREMQVNLVRSHAVGMGEPLPAAEVRAMMLLRANSLSKGFSGVRAEIIDALCEMLNRGVTPFVPSQGSVGASGDLALRAAALSSHTETVKVLLASGADVHALDDWALRWAAELDPNSDYVHGRLCDGLRQAKHLDEALD